MPGLRYQFGMSPLTSSLNRGDDNALAHHTSGISRDWEMSRPQNVPYSPNQSTKVRRSSQWLQQSKEDFKVNFLGTSKHWSSAAVVPDTTCESDDLQAMVHDFIENDCVEYMDGVDGDGASIGLTLIESLQILTKPHNTRERELLAEVERLMLTVNEDTDLICDAVGTGCKGTCIKRCIVKHLKASGYNASVCKSVWANSGHVPGGEYEYIDIVLEGDQPVDRFLIDINFQTQFKIARPTAQYDSALKCLPIVFVGTTANLEQVLRHMSEAAKVSLEQNDMHLPPWRTLDYMTAKWLSKYERKSDFGISSAHRGPCCLSWREKRTPITTEARNRGDEFRQTKNPLHVEANGSGLFNMPRGRSSRANLLLRSAA